MEWSLDEMTAILVKEEDDINNNRTRSISLVSNQEDKSKKFPPKKTFGPKQFKRKSPNIKRNWHHGGASSSGNKQEFFKGKCSFCFKFGHKKVNCWKFKAQQEKKGNSLMMVHLEASMIETNIIDVPINSWWLDTGASIHVTNSLQEMTN